jgi:hypothetical protein
MFTLYINSIRDYEAFNRMSANNLSIIFGPTMTYGNESLNPMVDMARRCKVVEMMIIYRSAIFTGENNIF